MCGVNRVAASCTMMLETVSASPSTAAMTSPSPPRVFRAWSTFWYSSTSASPPTVSWCCASPGRSVSTLSQNASTKITVASPRIASTGTDQVRSGSLYCCIALGSPSVVAPATCIARRISGVSRIAINELAATGRSASLSSPPGFLGSFTPLTVSEDARSRGRAPPPRAMHRADPW